MNIVVLTSQENFVWHSMQEIIPYIEETWKKADLEKNSVTILNVDNMSLAQITPRLLNATHLVLTCFNIKICKTAFFAREHLKLPLNFIVYVHNMATIAFWPFRKWGCENFFKKNDLFVTSCENDKNTLLKVFSKPQIAVIPFFVLNYKEEFLNKSRNKVDYMVYVGRISSQKNLHNLVLGYHLLKLTTDNIPPLVFFGKEDHLGSPNMGYKCNEYQSYLEKLIAQFGLGEHIIFKGHVDRSVINNFLSQNNCLSVSPSLHSDENFGMAILQSILLGNECVISDWGGHSDFKKYFSDRVKLMPVNNSVWGPSLSAQQIADSLAAVFDQEMARRQVALHEDYNISRQAEKLLNAISLKYENEELAFSDLANSIFKDKNSDSMQIFKDYCDLNFHKISETYRGEFSNNFTYPVYKKYNLVPWVQEVSGFYQIQDPHKGTYVLLADENSRELLFNGSYLICKN